jgi:hypothetical protein
MAKLSFTCSPVVVSKEGSPELPGFHVEGGGSSPKTLGRAERWGWVGSFTGGAGRRRKEEKRGRRIISRQWMVVVDVAGGELLLCSTWR